MDTRIKSEYDEWLVLLHLGKHQRWAPIGGGAGEAGNARDGGAKKWRGCRGRAQRARWRQERPWGCRGQPAWREREKDKCNAPGGGKKDFWGAGKAPKGPTAARKKLRGSVDRDDSAKKRFFIKRDQRA